MDHHYLRPAHFNKTYLLNLNTYHDFLMGHLKLLLVLQHPYHHSNLWNPLHIQRVPATNKAFGQKLFFSFLFSFFFFFGRGGGGQHQHSIMTVQRSCA